MILDRVCTRYKGRSKLQDNVQAVSTGLHARRATGLTVAESEESFTRTESVARWSRDGRAAYEAEREALLYVFLSFLIFDFFDLRKVFQ